MKKEKTQGMWKNTFGLLGRFPIPWYLYILQILLGIVSTKVALLYIPYYSSMQTGNLSSNVLLGYIGYTALNVVATIACAIPTFFASALITRELQKKMIEHSLRLPMSYYDEHRSSIVSWICNDCGSVNGLISSICSFFTGIATAVMSSSSIGELDKSMIMLVPFVLILLILFTLLEGKLLFLRQRREKRANSELTAYFSEHLSYLLQIKQMHTEKEELARSKKAIDDFYHADLYQLLLTMIDNFTSGSLTNIVTILVFVLGVPLVRSGKFDLAGLASFQSYVLLAYNSLSTIPSTYTQLMYYNGELYYIGGMMSEKEEKVKRVAGIECESDDINFSHVNFGYSKEQPILKDASFTIPKGKVTLLVGPNGSGKSTVFRLIERFYNPISGRISYGNRNVEEIHLDEWRKNIAYVLQEPSLFNGSVRDNITYGMSRDVTDDEVAAAARLAYADEFISDLPDGYDFIIGDNGSKLSGGQRQRIAIARAIMLDPSYLMLDEATCNMDVYSEKAVTDALLRLMSGRTTIIISHDMRMLNRADHVIVLKDGVVEADGSRDEVIQTSDTLKQLMSSSSNDNDVTDGNIMV